MKGCLTCGAALTREEKKLTGICNRCVSEMKFYIDMTCPVCGDQVQGKPAPFNEIVMSCGHKLILCQNVAWIPSSIDT